MHVSSSRSNTATRTDDKITHTLNTSVLLTRLLTYLRRLLGGAYSNGCVCPSICTSASTHRSPHNTSTPELMVDADRNEIKRSQETQTLRAGCSKAEPKIVAPPQTPFPGARDGQNLISWRYGHCLYLQTMFGEDRYTQLRVIMVTDPQTQKHPETRRPPAHRKHTDRTDYNTLRHS